MTDTQKVKVLAVDDSKTMLAMISMHLKGSKFELVATASDAPEALEKYKQHRPQLVLMDLVMPKVTGAELLDQLLETDNSACVVIVSSAGTEQSVHDCLKKGAKSFLQKPLQKEAMLALLKNVCEEAGVEL